jgi:hypothetical protein
MMYPTLPGEVALLTTGEFAFGLELNNAPSFEEACRRFRNDANRAHVWLIRLRALKTWCARDDITQWMSAARLPYICEVAAAFELNDQWEFDATTFCLAVDEIRNRCQRERGYWVGMPPSLMNDVARVSVETHSIVKY